MSRRQVLLLNEWTANNARARRSYDADMAALDELLKSPCARCKGREHRKCSGRARPAGAPDGIPCGCAENGHPRRRRKVKT